MDLGSRIVEIISEAGFGYKEKSRTIYTTCPICQQDDKFSILKENGACVCYRGSCDFGKRWFLDWMSLAMDITPKEAKRILYGKQEEKATVGSSTLDIDVSFLNKKEEKKSLLDGILPVEYPEFHMKPMDDASSAEGAAYISNRGISVEFAKKLGICYSSVYRRVIFPIKMGDKVYGWQGRHIDKVDDSMRMRNNEGFRRDTLVMFADNLIKSDFAILAEGPFDALKFLSVGGFVASMGKSVADKQLQIIFDSDIKRLYLALDDDAGFEMMDIITKSKVPVFKIDVPESCRQRCKISGKKADFGECTFEEAERAFLDAKKVDHTTLLIKID